MKRITALCLATALTACGTPIDPADLPLIDGVWTVTESISTSSSSCRFVGTLEITQEGETFAGLFTRTGQCSISNLQGTTAAAQSGSTSAGRVRMDTVDFRIGDCDYRGIISGSEGPTQISGTIVCATILVSGGISTSTGTWSASRNVN